MHSAEVFVACVARVSARMRLENWDESKKRNEGRRGKERRKNSKLILAAGRVIEKIKKENKNKVGNYICPIFRLQHKLSTGVIPRRRFIPFLI